MSAPDVTIPFEKHFSSSVLLWMRTDRPRQAGMNHWKGPHSGIIAASPGLTEYRQVHLAEDNPGRWPAVDGVETQIPADRRVDGIAEVTFESVLAPVKGRAQTQLAFADEANVFRRTLLHAGPPGSSRWYDVGDGEVGARTVLYLRRAPGIRRSAFRSFVTTQLAPTLAASSDLKELRTQVFLPWNERTWDTPGVAHDNPKGDRLHASVILGFADHAARADFHDSVAPTLAPLVAPHLAALHAYDVDSTLTFVHDERVLETPRS